MPTRRAKYYETTSTPAKSVSHDHLQQILRRCRYTLLQSMWPPRRHQFSTAEVLQEQASPVPRIVGHKSQKIWSRYAVVANFLVTLNRRTKRKTIGRAN